MFDLLDKLDVLKSKKDPVIACIVGLLFGSIGIGIYLQSLTDFLIPLLCFVALTILIPGVGAIPGWLCAGLYGYFRVVNSNERRRK